MALEALYAAKLEAGLAPASVANIHAVIHRALARAERLGLVSRNVAALVRAPRPKSPEMQSLTAEQAHALLDAATGDRLEALYVLAVSTGMRLGELLALEWADVNLDTGAVTVLHTLTWMGGAIWQLDTPKTLKSRRRIQLAPLAVEALRAHRARQLAERLAASPDEWHDHDLVFTRQDGEPLRAQHVLQRQLHPLLARTGPPHIRFHDLRHTAATLLVSEVPLKVASELLGQ